MHVSDESHLECAQADRKPTVQSVSVLALFRDKGEAIDSSGTYTVGAQGPSANA